MKVRYPDGPIEVGMIFTSPDNDGRLGHRRLRVLAEHPDGGWILEDLPARMRNLDMNRMIRCPELNLRVVFEPERKKEVRQTAPKSRLRS